MSFIKPQIKARLTTRRYPSLSANKIGWREGGVKIGWREGGVGGGGDGERRERRELNKTGKQELESTTDV